MKRISYLLFFPILVISIIGVVGCGNDDVEQAPFNMDTEDTFYPNNDISNEVREFFESKLIAIMIILFCLESQQIEKLFFSKSFVTKMEFCIFVPNLQLSL